MSILVVDDSTDVRVLATEVLSRKGYTCYEASSGAEALEVLATGTIELALLDIVMPNMTRLALFERLRESHPDVAVVFNTGVDDLRLAVDHLKKGAYDYLVKPISRERLERAVEDALDRRRNLLEGRNRWRSSSSESSARKTRSRPGAPSWMP